MPRRLLLALLFFLCALSLSTHFTVESQGPLGPLADWHEEDQFMPGKLDEDVDIPGRSHLCHSSHPKTAALALSPLPPPPIAA